MRFLSAGRRRSLAGQLFAMQAVVVAFVVVGGAALAYWRTERSAADGARRQVTAVAVSIAEAPATVQAVTGADPSAVLQPYVERVRRDTGVEFVTIMSPQGIRYTHPNPAMIGKPFLGHTERALAGHTFTETFTGTLGRSVRVVTPVFGDQHRVVALVSAGITLQTLSAQLRIQLLVLIGVALLALAIGGAGTYVANARLRRHTHGMNTAELGRMYEYHHAILHTVREGLLLLDPGGRIVLANDGARALLRLPADAEGSRVAELGLPEALTAALSDAGPCVDEIHLTRDHVVVVNKSAVTSGSRDLGSVVTLRDHTELQTLSGELDSVRGFAESLHSQTHEAANRLHTVISLIELGRTQEAVEFATAELEVAQRLTDEVVEAVAEPVLAALLLGKAAQANERGVELVITADTRIDDGVLPEDLGQRELVTILGNLIDNAIDAAAGRHDHPPMVFVTARADGGRLVFRVADTGHGVRDDAVRAGARPRAGDPGGRPPRWQRRGGPGRRRGVHRHASRTRGGDGVIDVLVVEDDRTAAEAHRRYVERVPGFGVTEVVHSGAAALRVLDRRPVDLVLLDFFLPDCNGLDVCRRLRAAGHPADVIAVTSARDLAMVRSAVSAGVVQYVLKPFTYATLRAKLERYARFHTTLGRTGEAADQDEVDRALATLRTPGGTVLPKGVSALTLEAVRDVLRGTEEGVTAEEAARTAGISRVTARRYLEYLVDRGDAERAPRYGQVGRPELRYRRTRVTP